MGAARVSLALALAAAAGGCFALFSLDGYGPPAALLLEGGADAPSDTLTEAEAASPITGKRVFVTGSELTVDELRDVATADGRCAQAAASAGLTGTFLAWLSDDARSPSSRFSAWDAGEAGALQLITTKNDVVASGYAELVDSGPRVSLDVTENGAMVPHAPAAPFPGPGECPDAGLVWTGTTSMGTPNMHNCSAWQATGPGTTGRAGRIAKDAIEWTSACNLRCNLSARLYCFEQ
jgi:hypothetical protein